MFSTPSSPQFSNQQVVGLNNGQQSVQPYYGNQNGNQQLGFGRRFFGNGFDGNSSFNYGQRFSESDLYHYNQHDFEYEANQLRALEHQIHSIHQTLQQGMMSGNNPQVSRDITEFIINHIGQSHDIIQMAKRHYQDRQINSRSAYERQEYEQRERQLIRLDQIMDQIRQVVHHRMNNFDHSMNQPMMEEAMQLINHAQSITHDVNHQAESHYFGQGNQWNQGRHFGGNHQYQHNMINGNQDWRNMNQYQQRSPFEQSGFGSFNQQYQNNGYQRGSSSPVMGQTPRFGMQPSHL